MAETISNTPVYDSFQQFMPMRNLAPADQRAVLEEMASHVVRIVASEGVIPRHEMAGRLAADYGYLTSDAGLGVLFATDEEYLLDHGVPSQLSLPEEA